MTLGKAFSIRLDNILKQRNIKLSKFLRDSCIARSTIINIQQGNTKCPTLALIYQVADGLGMTYLEFLDDPIFDKLNVDYL